MRKLHPWVFVALLGFAGAGAAQVDGKVGFVNLDRILRDAAPAQRAQKKIEGEFSKRETLMFNGYADEVSGLYTGMDLRVNF